MKEVIDVPCLVPDPEVVVPLFHGVVEHHEVRREDLVHPPECLEDPEVVLASHLRLDVLRFAGKLR